jgi:hypothetical protein
MSFQENTTKSSESPVELTAGVGETEPTSGTDTIIEFRNLSV